MSVFITGTDTEVGKTCISAAIIDIYREQGLRVAGMKPIASGCETTHQGLRNDDALTLMSHANVDLAYDVVNPYAFEPAIAPHIAAMQVGIDIKPDSIKQRFNDIQSQVDVVVVEGAGGWLVPINNSQTIADLAVELALPVILVVGIRLGCINHALLTAEAIKHSGLQLMGWVANHVEENAQSSEIISSLQQRLASPCLGVVPYLTSKQQAKTFLNLGK